MELSSERHLRSNSEPSPRRWTGARASIVRPDLELLPRDFYAALLLPGPSECRYRRPTIRVVVHRNSLTAAASVLSVDIS